MSQTKNRTLKMLNKLIVDYPIFAVVLLQLKMVEKPLPEYADMAVNPMTRELILNSAIDFNRVSDTELRLGLLHEAGHIMNGTATRKGTRNVLGWNIATDFEINWMLYDMKEPINNYDYLFSELYWREKWWAEKIYDANPQLARLEEPDNQGRHDEHIYPENEEEEQVAKQMIKESQASVQQMLQAEYGIGKFPEGLKRLINRLLEDHTDWSILFNDALAYGYTSYNNFSYSKFNKNYVPFDIYIPGLKSNETKVVIVCDTSGSIGSQELKHYLSKVKGIIASYDVTFIAIDAAVQTVVTDTNDIQKIVESVKGGGGTVFAPAFKWIEENIFEPSVVVLMTDGYNGDQYIPVPMTVTKIITLTTGKKPEGITSDITIDIKEEVMNENS